MGDLSKMPGDDGEEVTIKDLRSPPRNARFPQYNQMRYCFDEYWQFQSCMAKASKAGEDGESKCLPMYKNLMALCPNEWAEPWDEAVEDGRWAWRPQKGRLNRLLNNGKIKNFHHG